MVCGRALDPGLGGSIAHTGVADGNILNSFSGWLPLSRLKEIAQTIKTLRPGSSDLHLDLEEKARPPVGALHVI